MKYLKFKYQNNMNCRHTLISLLVLLSNLYYFLEKLLFSNCRLPYCGLQSYCVSMYIYICILLYVCVCIANTNLFEWNFTALYNLHLLISFLFLSFIMLSPHICIEDDEDDDDEWMVFTSFARREKKIECKEKRQKNYRKIKLTHSIRSKRHAHSQND